MRIPLFGIVVAAGLAGCAPLLPAAVPDDTSSEFEPPRSWEAGVKFMLVDTTYVWSSQPPPVIRHGIHVEFFDGQRDRRAEGRDVFATEAGEARTPWYRIWLPEGAPERRVTLRFTVGDATGARTVAEYDLTVKRDDFYRVRAVVGTHRHERPVPPWAPFGMRGYPVPPGARAAPGDSLWVGYHVTGRECFGCL